MNNTEAVLKARAIEAANIIERFEQTNGINVVVFMLGKDLYAIEAEVIQDVHTYSKPTTLPHLPPYLEGILHIRGRFVSIVNLKRFLGVEATRDEPARTILLLNDGVMECGVSVDEVIEQSALDQDKIRPLPSGFNLPKPDLIRGITEGGMSVLSGKNLLADPDMTIYQEVVTSYKGRFHVS
ncbi:MAG: chemotaxis protein CheW [Sulfuricurvum sp.]|nr:chemotaxis protein CheW [Sulfuricurvum sp.]